MGCWGEHTRRLGKRGRPLLTATGDLQRGCWASRAHWAGRDTSMVRNTGAHGKGAPNGGSGHRRGHLLPRSSAANQCREGSEPLSSSKHAAVAYQLKLGDWHMQTSSEYLLAWSGQSGQALLRYVEQCSTRKHGMQTFLMHWVTSAGTSLRSTSMESTARDRRRDCRDDGWSRGRLTDGGRKVPTSGAAPSYWLPAAPRAPQRA